MHDMDLYVQISEYNSYFDIYDETPEELIKRLNELNDSYPKMVRDISLGKIVKAEFCKLSLEDQSYDEGREVAIQNYRLKTQEDIDKEKGHIEKMKKAKLKQEFSQFMYLKNKFEKEEES